MQGSMDQSIDSWPTASLCSPSISSTCRNLIDHETSTSRVTLRLARHDLASFMKGAVGFTKIEGGRSEIFECPI